MKSGRKGPSRVGLQGRSTSWRIDETYVKDRGEKPTIINTDKVPAYAAALLSWYPAGRFRHAGKA